MGWTDLAPVVGPDAANGRVKLIPRKAGGTTINIPPAVAKLAGLEAGCKMKVQIDMLAATRKLRFFADRAGPFTFKPRRHGAGFVNIGKGELPQLKERIYVEHQRDSVMIELVLPEEWQRPKPPPQEVENRPGAAWRNGKPRTSDAAKAA